jgi:putative Holliday junction resolvase
LPLRGRVLAIDVGDKRIGLALSDPTQTLAQPLATLTRRVGKRFPMGKLKQFIDTHRPVALLLGLPLAPDGSEDERAVAVREVGALLMAKAELPVAYWDERMSTARVHSAVREWGGTLGRKGDVDQLAATVFLQTYLDSRRC